MTAQDVGTEAQRESGKTLYLKNCSQCHGEKGDGEGYATPHLYPRPRNFTTAQVQGSDDSQRSAPDPSGPRQHHQARHALHVDARLANTLRPGSVGSRLLHYDLLPRFLEQGKRSEAGGVPERPEHRRARRSSSGRNSTWRPAASSATATSVGATDLRLQPWWTSWAIRYARRTSRRAGPSGEGSSREDIFRTMSTGLNGTPMPSFSDSLTPEQRWAITDFIVSLSGSNGPGYTNLVVAKYVPDPIDLKNGAASFESAPVARFPIVGQITGARTRVPSSRDLRDRSGDLRRASRSPFSFDGTT